MSACAAKQPMEGIQHVCKHCDGVERQNQKRETVEIFRKAMPDSLSRFFNAMSFRRSLGLIPTKGT